MKKLLLLLPFLLGCQPAFKEVLPVNCTVRKVGAVATLYCPDGTQTTVSDGTTGPKGDTGDKGDTGPAGPPGINGANGTPVNAVQFCSEQGSTVYPSHFPEYGLCISGALYGVYWNGTDAFLAEIVPGAYQSTSTGLKCNFTVAEGCLIN